MPPYDSFNQTSCLNSKVMTVALMNFNHQIYQTQDLQLDKQVKNFSLRLHQTVVLWSVVNCTGLGLKYVI